MTLSPFVFMFSFYLHNNVLYFYLTPVLSIMSLPHLFLKWQFQQLGTPGMSPPSFRSLSVWFALCSPRFQRGEKPLNTAQISWSKLLNYSANLYHNQYVIYYVQYIKNKNTELQKISRFFFFKVYSWRFTALVFLYKSRIK